MIQKNPINMDRINYCLSQSGQAAKKIRLSPMIPKWKMQKAHQGAGKRDIRECNHLIQLEASIRVRLVERWSILDELVGQDPTMVAGLASILLQNLNFLFNDWALVTTLGGFTEPGWNSGRIFRQGLDHSFRLFK